MQIVQHHFLSANPSENYKRIKAVLKEAQSDDVLVFPAFSLSGYPLKDELLQSDFIEKCWHYLQKIVKLRTDVTAILDFPCQAEDGLKHRAVVLNQGKISYFHDNTSEWQNVGLNYKKYFSNGINTQDYFDLKGKKTAVLFANELPGELPACEQLILLDAWSFESNTYKARLRYFSDLAKRIQIPVCLANAVGGQASLILAGASMQIDSDGQVVEQFPFFEELKSEELTKKKRYTNQDISEIALIYQALVRGLKDYFADRGFKSALIGLSGGIDSALVLPLAVAALGRKNVLGVLMPSQYSTKHSIDDAVKSAENLGVAYEIVPIENNFAQLYSSLKPVFGNKPFGLAEENLQARIRGTILMSIANKFGYVLLNTSNKTEAAMGYGTMYGDLCGGLSVIGDLYKCQVYELSNYINRKREIIPRHSIDKAPSAELRPNQKDSDSLPDYDVLDKVLRLYLEDKKTEKEILQLGFNKDEVAKILRLLKYNEYKRQQTPPQLRVSNTAFGIDIQHSF